MKISYFHLTDLAYLLRGIILWYGQHSLPFHRQLAHKNNKNRLTVAQLLNNSPHFIGVEDSLQTSEQPANGPYHAQYKLSAQLT
jgi:hypothetical protein